MDKDLLRRQYGLKVISAEKASVGAGSDTYFVTCDSGKYVVKFPCESAMNNPDAEPRLCVFLGANGVKASVFIRNLNAGYVTTDGRGRKYHVQKFVEGKTYGLNTAPKWLLRESAKQLGRIHAALKDYSGLPVGIGKDFFTGMTPERARQSYIGTLAHAGEKGDREIERDLSYRIGLMERFSDLHIDIGKLTCAGTHGDYFISQLICGENSIEAVIDWTTACVHPVVWEVIRSYVYAAPGCVEGALDIEEFLDYVAEYRLYAPLNRYDFEMMAKVFYYQIAVCDYYRQYYGSAADNRGIYLQQAVFSTRLMRWFERNVEDLSERLVSRFAE